MLVGLRNEANINVFKCLNVSRPTSRKECSMWIHLPHVGCDRGQLWDATSVLETLSSSPPPPPPLLLVVLGDFIFTVLAFQSLFLRVLLGNYGAVTYRRITVCTCRACTADWCWPRSVDTSTVEECSYTRTHWRLQKLCMSLLFIVQQLQYFWL